MAVKLGRGALGFALAAGLAGSAFGFCFEEAGRLYGVSPRLLRALARVESAMDPRAVNRNPDGSVDVGLMQINSRWRDRLRWDLVQRDPCCNVMAGAWILRQCIARYGSTWDAVACYNTGKGLKELRGGARKKAVRYVWKVWEALTEAKEAGSKEPRRPVVVGGIERAKKEQET